MRSSTVAHHMFRPVETDIVPTLRDLAAPLMFGACCLCGELRAKKLRTKKFASITFFAWKVSTTYLLWRIAPTVRITMPMHWNVNLLHWLDALRHQSCYCGRTWLYTSVFGFIRDVLRQLARKTKQQSRKGSFCMFGRSIWLHHHLSLHVRVLMIMEEKPATEVSP